MPVISEDDDQNIERLHTKMCERFPNDTDTNLHLNSGNFVSAKDSSDETRPHDLDLPYDHMYASNTENGEISVADSDCQSAESEVKFWKEWLILHLDLIQQQSDEILSKERTILILQQENEMLKERISCMERGAPFQASKFFTKTTPFIHKAMTQDGRPCDEDNKNGIDILDLNCDNSTNLKFERNSDNESQEKTAIDNKFDPHDIGDKVKSESEITHHNSSAEFNFTIENSGEFDPMRNLRMSIRRKRLSNSSAVSNNDSVIEEKRPFRKYKKRRKCVLKDSQILTTTDQYVTEASEASLRLMPADVPLDITQSANLEVPRWRVKVYGSCYAMEGTENLDDEVYNKRHSRLENDERRRKRWDVQRIREQRLVEKLKQRQERLGSGSRSDEQTDLVHSLWPNPEDVKYLEISDQLPVAAFGAPIPRFSQSEFSLPWLNNPSLIMNKKGHIKKSTVRRKHLKR